MNNKRRISQSDKTKNFNFFESDFYRHSAILLLFSVLFFTPVYGQIYNYSPISYSNIETNPSYLATAGMSNRIQLSHQNSFNPSRVFSSTNLKYSLYLPSTFIGVGVSLGTSKIANNVVENHAGIGIAYRNILFNKLYLKIGAMYKIVGTNTGSGTFDFYSFTPKTLMNEGTMQHNLNTSLTINSEEDGFFISVGALNIPLAMNNSSARAEFPSYYTLHIGNLMSFYRRSSGSEISYSGFIKVIHSEVTLNHYATVKFGMKLDRKSSIDFGSKLGFAENSYFHFIPFIGYIRKKIRVNLAYNFELDKTTFQPVYFEAFQFNLTLTL